MAASPSDHSAGLSTQGRAWCRLRLRSARLSQWLLQAQTSHILYPRLVRRSPCVAHIGHNSHYDDKAVSIGQPIGQLGRLRGRVVLQRCGILANLANVRIAGYPKILQVDIVHQTRPYAFQDVLEGDKK